jgi:hypothetical protein
VSFRIGKLRSGITDRRRRRILLGAALALGALAGPAQAATFTVGTTKDVLGTCANPATDVCSLRQLINYENGLATTPTPTDAIVVPAGNYDLSNGALAIGQSLAVVGAGARTTTITQSSTTPDRVFDVQLPANTAVPNVLISGLKITGGNANGSNNFFGGDIRNQANLTLSRDWVTGGSTTFGSGAGVSNDAGTLTVDHSLVSGNAGGNDSGGIQNFGASGPPDRPGHLLVTDSTIAGNSSSQGGGIFSWGDATNTTTVINSTIANNDGGTRNSPAGGLAGSGTISVQNSIVAFNTVDTPFTGAPVNCGSGISSLGYNLETGSDCGFTNPGDQQNTNPEFSATTPQNNGGDTDTLALAFTSPAVGHVPIGAAGCGGTDQRDVARPQGSGCDIGAFEFVVPSEGGQFSGALVNAGCAVSSTPQPTIDWGDGTTSAAGFPSTPQAGPLTGTHTYAEEGSYSVAVSWTDDCGPHTTRFSINIPDAPLGAGGSPVNATAGTQFSGPTAAFADADPGGTASDYTASIDWGDGTTSAGTVSASASGFLVSGAHTYASAGTRSTTISISDAGGATATARGSSTVANPPRAPAAVTNKPRVGSSSTAGFSGVVNPEGLATTAYFQYGLDARYRASAANVYDQSTPVQGVGSDSTAHPVSASVANLVPNALYHVRLVAVNGAGTTFGPDQTFTTKHDPPPRAPVLGKSANVAPVSGVVFIKLPKRHALDGTTAAMFATALSKGSGFIPLTEARQIPAGSQVDSRAGTLTLTTAGARIGKRQTGTFSGGLFAIGQFRTGLLKGLTTLSLLEGDFPGAPSYASCRTRGTSDRQAQTARGNPILQTLRARDRHGRFRTRGRYSAGTVRGTSWDTTDRCDGTLTIVHRGTVDVTDFGRRKTITLHAGHSYLAKAGTTRKRK